MYYNCNTFMNCVLYIICICDNSKEKKYNSIFNYNNYIILNTECENHLVIPFVYCAVII